MSIRQVDLPPPIVRRKNPPSLARQFFRILAGRNRTQAELVAVIPARNQKFLVRPRAPTVVATQPLLREVKVPWLIVLGVSALFIAVDLALGHGLRELLAGWVGTGTGTSDLLRVSAFGAGTANVADNLPAYLALESVTDNDPHRLMALLIGVNAGPLVTIWASLATILWRERCRRAGIAISLWRFAWQGAVCATAATLAATLALALT